MPESWHEVNRQINEQVRAFRLMEQMGMENYERKYGIKRRDLSKIKYVPCDGVNVESIWASADAQIEAELENKQKK